LGSELPPHLKSVATLPWKLECTTYNVPFILAKTVRSASGTFRFMMIN